MATAGEALQQTSSLSQRHQQSLQSTTYFPQANTQRPKPLPAIPWLECTGTGHKTATTHNSVCPVQVAQSAALLQCAYHAGLEVRPSPTAQPALSTQAASQIYQQSLASAQQLVQQFRVSANTSQQRFTHMDELAMWLSQMPWGRGIQQACPADLIAYCQQWTSKHKKYVLADKRVICTPNSLDQMLSHQACQWDQAGRSGDWQDNTLSGNPVRSQAILDFKKSYRHWAVAQGYLERSAVPLPATSHEDALSSLYQEYCSQNGIQKAITARDGAMVSILWATKLRGKEVGSLLLSSIQPDSHGAACLYPCYSMQPGNTICLKPVRTKTEPGLTARPRLLIAKDASSHATDPCWWLSAALCSAAACGQPVHHHLFRPTAGHRFKESLITSSTLNGLIKRRLQALDPMHNHTPHSYRRGSLQEDERQGKSREEMKAGAVMRSDATLARYLDPYRHITAAQT